MAGLRIEEIYKSFFEETDHIVRASSPGSMDVMGGVADYSGSLLLQKTISESTSATVALRTNGLLRIRSASEDHTHSNLIFRFPVSSFYNGSILKTHEQIRKDILRIRGGEWAIYVAGCFFLLAADKNIPIEGADVLIESNIPIGKGVSSSAALEVSVLMALNRLYNLDLGEQELPELAQRVENQIVGAPCGLMDQLTSYLGREESLLPIVCQPCEVFDPVGIPRDVHFVGIDSGTRHSVSGASYIKARTAAFMGYSIIARNEKVSDAGLARARENGRWSRLPFGGYLSNIDVPVFETRFKPILPGEISGEDFLDQYGAVIDPVTRPKPWERYAVRQCTSHAVYENKRVNEFKEYFTALSGHTGHGREECLARLGDLMYESHKSYSLCGLGNERTDELVGLVRDAGRKSGLYGAKITGGGSGGTVCVLCDGEEGLREARIIAGRYSAKYGLRLSFFEGSSEGGLYRED